MWRMIKRKAVGFNINITLDNDSGLKDGEEGSLDKTDDDYLSHSADSESMDPKSKQSKCQDDVLSLLDVIIEALNLVANLSSITPARTVFSTIGIILTMMRVSSLLLCRDPLPLIKCTDRTQWLMRTITSTLDWLVTLSVPHSTRGWRGSGWVSLAALCSTRSANWRCELEWWWQAWILHWRCYRTHCRTVADIWSKVAKWSKQNGV